MDQGHYRRRQAKAVAISESAEVRRNRAAATVMFVLASMAVVLEALTLAQNIWVSSHP